jgi:hypothetical protein
LPIPRWIIDNQAGRRNLKPDQMSLLRGEIYNREKGKQGGTGANQHKQNPQNEDSAKTAERLATQYGVSRAIIERDGQYAAAVDTLAANLGEDVREKVLSGDSKVTKESIIVLAKESPEKQKEVFASVEAEILKAAEEIKRERG